MEHLPPWLRNVPLPLPPDDSDETPAWLRGIDRITPPSPPSAEAIPDWLTVPEPATAPADVPDWLAELQTEVSDPLDSAEPALWLAEAAPEPPPERPSLFGATGWLQSLSSEPAPAADSPAEPPPTTSSRVRMPVGPTDWLRSIGHEEAIEPAPEPAPEPASLDPNAGVPEWLRDLSEEELTQAFAEAPSEPSVLPSEPVAAAGQPSEPALDDWLNELAEIALPANPPDWVTGAAADDETVFATDVPEWATPNRPPAGGPPVPDLPAWLQNVAGDEPPAAPGSVRLDLPSWLLDEDFMSPPTTTTPPVAPDAPTLVADSNAALRNVTSSDVDVPAWLTSEVEPALQPEAPEVPEAQETPDWLLEAEQQLSAASPEPALLDTSPTAGSAGDVPTWLREADAGDRSGWESAASEAGTAPVWSQEGEEEVGAALAWLQEEEPSDLVDSSLTTTLSDIPTWLREADASDLSAWENEQPAAASEVPAWLQAEEPAAASEVPAWLQAEDLAEPDEIPAWLRTEEPASPSEEPALPSEALGWLQAEEPAAASEVPGWLRAEEPAAPSEVPGWLRAEEPAAPSEVPGWLRAEEPAAASEVPGWLQAEEPAAASEVPGWLQAEEPAAASEVPAWLRAEEPAAASEVPAWLQDASAGRIETPDWLNVEAPSDAMPWLQAELAGLPAASEPPPTTSSTSDEFFSGAELPPWLRASPERVVESTVSPSITWLERLRNREAEVEEETVAAPEVAVIKPPLPAPTPRTADQVAAMALLERLIQSPLPMPAPVEQPAVVRRRLPSMEQLLALALLIVVLVGTLLPNLMGPFVQQAQPSPAAIALSERLAALGSDDVVLVAYEWGAQRVAELRPLEQALLDQLIVDRTKLIIVSTDLQGALLSFDLIGPLRAAGYNNENGVTFGGRDYVLLGYRPGGELALRSMAIDLRAQLRRDYIGQDATAGLLATRPDGSPRVQTLADLALIVVMADQVQDVQAWMEQIHSVAPEVPIAFLLPQEVYPQVLPYLRLPNVYAVAGQRGASDLLAAGVADEAATTMLAVQTWATIAFVVVLMLGGLVVVSGRLRPAARGKA